jgi:hypothetical protein
MDQRLEGTPLILRAVELVIEDLEECDYPERNEQLTQLNALRTRLLAEMPSRVGWGESSVASLLSREGRDWL